MIDYTTFMEQGGHLLSGEERRATWAKYFHENVAAGDGVTVCYWTDTQSYTVIRRTKNKLVLQRDKATRDPSFKPDFIPGGFSVVCLNDSAQKWIVEPDPSGMIREAYWSDRKQGFFVNGSLRVIAGRHEYYDFNF